MLTIEIPGWKTLYLAHLFLDYNGTLALDGILLPGVRERLNLLAPCLEIHVLTANTFGSVRVELDDIACDLLVIPAFNQTKTKAEYLHTFNPAKCVAIGNGRNDALMLQEAALGIALLQEEGAASQTLAAADVICRNIRDALDLLLSPLRLAATLRE